jgi:hypothetical protein
VNVETKERLKQWMRTHSRHKLKSLNNRSLSKKLMTTVFWDRRGEVMVEFMQQQITLTSEVHCETLNENCIGLFRTKDAEC